MIKSHKCTRVVDKCRWVPRKCLSLLDFLLSLLIVLSYGGGVSDLVAGSILATLQPHQLRARSRLSSRKSSKKLLAQCGVGSSPSWPSSCFFHKPSPSDRSPSSSPRSGTRTCAGPLPDLASLTLPTTASCRSTMVWPALPRWGLSLSLF